MSFLRSSYLFESHQSHRCGLQPVLEYLYYIIKNIPSRYLVLHLSLCQPPISIFYSAATFHMSSFRITNLLSEQFPISIHILIHLPSKLFIYFLFVLIYTPFNLSLLFSVRFHTSFFCPDIASYHIYMICGVYRNM